jgi:mRNA-degrading endonuclease RelE of RelBE toxin-antitoxin system
VKWSVELAPKAQRQLARTDPTLRLHILQDLLELRDDPRPGPPKVKKLRGFSVPTCRFRSGDYRAIYRIEGNVVVVGSVIHRRDLEREVRALR